MNTINLRNLGPGMDPEKMCRHPSQQPNYVGEIGLCKTLDDSYTTNLRYNRPSQRITIGLRPAHEFSELPPCEGFMHDRLNITSFLGQSDVLVLHTYLKVRCYFQNNQ